MTTESDNTGEPQELRAAYDKLKADFNKQSTDYRHLLATTTFEKAKLNPKHAELFLKVNGNEPITAEAATKFAEDYGLEVKEVAQAPQEQAPPPEQQPSPLASMSGAGHQAGGTGNTQPLGPKMTQAEFQKLYVRDKATAVKAYAEGKVEHAEGNISVREAVEKGLIVG